MNPTTDPAEQIRPQENSNLSLHQQTVRQLFSTLQLIYNNRFVKQGENLDDKLELWEYSLRRISESQIRSAAARVMDYYPSHPPLIGEFKKVIATVNATQQGQSIDSIVCPACRSHIHSQRHKEHCQA